ncbi:hypothetical protein CcCBS67573_g09537 [Chytriomyces confervae]|uniref:Uncharacterized protein n=1 Tax=Chytriomyces confervae TaxID=246404 RepID=A0A507DSR6_9FUNG|nr:hypothetical protein CcCBS67573_g09537 [Chytriomyces confervae]
MHSADFNVSSEISRVEVFRQTVFRKIEEEKRGKAVETGWNTSIQLIVAQKDHRQIRQSSTNISSSALGALCVVVLAPTETIETPKSTMNTIQQFRQKYDKAAPRWPPHVTLIPPPQPPVSQVTLKQLQDAFTPITQQCASIELLFDTVSVFSHRGGSSTIVLEPSETSLELEHLKRQLDASLPERINVRPDRHEFRPHLTVATMAAGDPARCNV